MNVQQLEILQELEPNIEVEIKYGSRCEYIDFMELDETNITVDNHTGKLTFRW